MYGLQYVEGFALRLLALLSCDCGRLVAMKRMSGVKRERWNILGSEDDTLILELWKWRLSRSFR